MVREFTLVDGSGEEYSLTNEEHLLYNPSGLGFEYENTYRQVGNRFILANSVQKQSVISGTVHFSAPDAYYDYQEFIEFCGRDNLKMEYRLSEMPSRRVKRLTGTVDWDAINNGQYSGVYNFITGDYLFTEKTITVTDVSEVTSVQTFAGGAATLYSVSISDNRNVNEKTYCNGIPALDSVLSASLTYADANGTFLGGDSSKIYFSLHQDAYQGETFEEWLETHTLKFSYTLLNPISGNSAAYKFNPKLMYNPLLQFISVSNTLAQSSATGHVSYVNSDQETVELDGSDLILENTELNQELSSLVVHREIQNKNENSRYEFVGTDLVTAANKSNLEIGDATTRSVSGTASYGTPVTYSYNYPMLQLGYVSIGTHQLTFVGNLEFRYDWSSGGTGYPMDLWGAVQVEPVLNFRKRYTSGNEIVASIVLPTSIHDPTDYINRKTYNIPISAINLSFNESVNDVLYLSPSVKITCIEGTKGGHAGTVSNFVFLGIHASSCSIKFPYASSGAVAYSDLKAFPYKSIAQISQADSQHYQRAVRLNKVEKTELTKFSSLETKVEFECLEPWGDPFTSFVEHGTSPDPVNSIAFDTDCHALSPCDLYISGPCTNPTWTQTVNGIEVTTGGYTGTIAAGEQLLIRAKDGACGIYLINGSGNTDDVYKYSDFSKDRFVFIRYGENVITVTDGTDPTTQIDCYIEGELYYESV